MSKKKGLTWFRGEYIPDAEYRAWSDGFNKPYKPRPSEHDNYSLMYEQGQIESRQCTLMEGTF